MEDPAFGLEATLNNERQPFRPSRTNYPGSRFGPKSRYDLPTRRKAYGNQDESDIILFSGTSLQPSVSLGKSLDCVSTPRGPAFGDAARSILHPLADRNLPDFPIVDENNDVHGILVLGGKGSGKTSLILSLDAVIKDAFPAGSEAKEKRHSMPAYGQSYEIPERDVKLGNGEVKSMKLVLTDTPPCGTHPREEQPMCSTVSPNSTQHFNAIPSWIRLTMRSGNFPHYSVVFVVDSTAKPLWEDSSRCRELARLLVVLKKSQYTVVIAVTKLLASREKALRDVANGYEHQGKVGKDPRTNYESYAGRYLDRVCASIQAKAGENDWSFSQGPDAPPFPLVNVTIFDVPTWVSVLDHKMWQDRKGTLELPNLKYYRSQLSRLLQAAAVRSHQ